MPEPIGQRSQRDGAGGGLLAQCEELGGRRGWSHCLFQPGGEPRPIRLFTSSNAISCGQVMPSARATYAAACATIGAPCVPATALN